MAFQTQLVANIELHRRPIQESILVTHSHFYLLCTALHYDGRIPCQHMPGWYITTRVTDHNHTITSKMVFQLWNIMGKIAPYQYPTPKPCLNLSTEKGVSIQCTEDRVIEKEKIYAFVS